MKIIISRLRVKLFTTDGRLYIDGHYICDTAESTPCMLAPGKYRITIFKCLKSKRNIPIITSPPSPDRCQRCTEAACETKKLRIAEYMKLESCTLTEDCRNEIRAFEQEVTTISQFMMDKISPICCPKIACGNGAFHRTDGSILVGNYLQPGVVLHSRPCFDRLYDRIEKALARGTDIELIIQ